MKKRVYFLISAIVQIVFSILMFFSLDTMVDAKINAYDAAKLKGFVDLFTNYGAIVIIIENIIPIVINLFLISKLKNDKYLNKKGLFTGLYIFAIFITTSLWAVLLEIVNVIILALSKRTESIENNDKNVEKKEIPKLEYKKSTKKEILLGILMIIVYILIQSGIYILFVPENVSDTVGMIIDILMEVVLFVMSIVIFKDVLKNDIKIFKENKKEYKNYILPRFAIYVVIFIILNFCAMSITGGQSANQKNLQELLTIWEQVLLSIIWAPIVEEVVFRGCIRRFIKNDIIFIIISAILFGLPHVISEQNIINALVNLVPYAFMGGFFAYMYAKTKNIFTNIFCHALWNSICVVMLLLSCLLS